jgi:uncharacterized membrane protein YphA (DoxX/SURF4 family)
MTIESDRSRKGDGIMDIVITVMQVLLGLLFTVGGLLKLTLPYAKYTNLPGVGWSKEFKPGHLRLIGALEASGGVGLLVPLFLHSLTMLTPLAAVGLALYMAGAMATHLRRSEYPHMVGNLLFFLAPALFVAYGRLIGFVV